MAKRFAFGGSMVSNHTSATEFGASGWCAPQLGNGTACDPPGSPSGARATGNGNEQGSLPLLAVGKIQGGLVPILISTGDALPTARGRRFSERSGRVRCGTPRSLDASGIRNWSVLRARAYGNTSPILSSWRRRGKQTRSREARGSATYPHRQQSVDGHVGRVMLRRRPSAPAALDCSLSMVKAHGEVSVQAGNSGHSTCAYRTQPE
jgi:hypothetical protein